MVNRKRLTTLAGLTFLSIVIGGIVGNLVKAQDPACFIETESGEVNDLANICGADGNTHGNVGTYSAYNNTPDRTRRL